MIVSEKAFMIKTLPRSFQIESLDNLSTFEAYYAQPLS